jgi:hypothetical protein
VSELLRVPPIQLKPAASQNGSNMEQTQQVAQSDLHQIVETVTENIRILVSSYYIILKDLKV